MAKKKFHIVQSFEEIAYEFDFTVASKILKTLIYFSMSIMQYWHYVNKDWRYKY